MTLKSFKKNKLKIVVFGSTKNTMILLDKLYKYLEIDTLISINSKKAKDQKVFNYNDLSKFCKKKKINFYEVKKFNLKDSRDFKFFKEKNFDIGFVNGWQRLIPLEILKTFKIGIFGMHGSFYKLPRGRGRSPLNWSLIENRKSFLTNLFKYKDGIDNGEIVDNLRFKICSNDNIELLHYKNTICMSYLIKKNIIKIISNKKLKNQSTKTKATYYPKREPEDSYLNFNENLIDILNLIKASTIPFHGAYCFINNKKMFIYEGQKFEDKNFSPYNSFSISTVVDILDKKRFIVKCNDGFILINKYIYDGFLNINDKFEYQKKRKFKKNSDGTFDQICF